MSRLCIQLYQIIVPIEQHYLYFPCVSSFWEALAWLGLYAYFCTGAFHPIFPITNEMAQAITQVEVKFPHCYVEAAFTAYIPTIRLFLQMESKF